MKLILVQQVDHLRQEDQGARMPLERRARALAEAAKKKVEWQYAKLEMQKKVELKMNEV